MNFRNSEDREVYMGARPKISADTGLGLSSTVLSASTPKLAETQDEIRRLTREYETLQREVSQPRERVYTRRTRVDTTSTDKPIVRPSKYDGSVPWEDYVVQFELISELNEWSNEQKTLFLATSLSGNAQSVLADVEKAKRKDYKSLCDALSRKYGTENRTELFRIQLKNIRKRKEQSLPELAQNIKRLSCKAYPKAQVKLQETLSRYHFIDALDETDTRLRIHQAHPESLDDAVKLAVELEAFYIADKQRDRPSSVRNFAVVEDSDFAGQIKTLTNLVEELRQDLQSYKRANNQGNRSGNNANFRKTGKSGQCWTCGKTGHMKRDCPRPKESRESQQYGQVRTGRVSNENCGLYISGKVQGHNVQCLVDNGANVTILNRKVFDILSDGNKVSLCPTYTNMKLADGKAVNVTGIGKMNIQIGQTSVSHEVWVADIDEDIECIIGFDFMKANKCCINIADNTATINNEKIRCAVVNTRVIRCCRVAVAKTIVVPPGVEQIVPGKVLDVEHAPVCGMLVPTKKFVDKHQLLLAKTLVSSTLNTVPIRVLNVTDKSVKLYEKTVAATCEAVTVVKTSNDNADYSSEIIPEHLSNLYSKSCEHLNVNEQEKLKTFLLLNESVFAKNKCDVGKQTLYHIRLTLKTPSLSDKNHEGCHFPKELN